MSGPVLGWADVSPEFGSALPNGSCNAFVQDEDHGMIVCGFPRRPDGTCTNGHPGCPETDVVTIDRA